MLKIKMDKTPQKVPKDPKRQERGEKSNEMYMKRLKECIITENQLSTSSSTGNSTLTTGGSMPSTNSSISMVLV